MKYNPIRKTVKEENTEGKEIVELLDRLLLTGYKSNASDIHIEPQENGLIIRMRIFSLIWLDFSIS